MGLWLSGSVAGCSVIASVAEDVLVDGLVASTIGIWTEVSLQVALVRKWVSRWLNLPPHLVYILLLLGGLLGESLL